MVLRVPIIGTPLGDTMNFLNDTIQLAYNISTFGGDDNITGANLSDVINGGDGNDSLFGAGGDDFLFGGNGNDFMRGGDGNDSLSGDAGADQLFGNNGNDGLSGGSSRDSLFGGAGNDSLNGGSDNDLLVGGSGRDAMTGGSGNDIFRFDSVSESVRGSSRDVITDFVRGADDINLDPIDASTLAAGDQDFSFIGTSGFTAGVAGQVRYFNTFTNDGQGITVVQADVNGDRIADLEIELRGNYALSVSDFDL